MNSTRAGKVAIAIILIANIFLAQPVLATNAFAVYHVAQAKKINDSWQTKKEACEAAGTITKPCANQAYDVALEICSHEAALFSKNASNANYAYLIALGLGVIGTSLGASTIASAKAWAVFGGASGVGAASAALNSQTSTLEGSVTSINKYVGDLMTFATTPKAQAVNEMAVLPTDDALFKQSNGTAAQCLSVGNTSPNATAGAGKSPQS